MSDASSSTPKQKRLLDAGLTALKQGDYARAIADLEAVVRSVLEPVPAPLKARAQMGLVVAYAKVGDYAQAVPLCQYLCDHADAKVREWALKTQPSLIKQAAASTAAGSGTAPSESAASEAAVSNPNADPAAGPAAGQGTGVQNLTGFVPLETLPPRSRAVGQRMSAIAANTPSIQRSPDFAATATPPQAPEAAAARGSAGENAGGQGVPVVERLGVERLGVESPGTVPAYEPRWRQAGRVGRLPALGQLHLWPLWLVQGGTAISLFWLVQQLVFQPNNIFWRMAIAMPLLHMSYAFREPGWVEVLVGLGLLAVGSRWLLDVFLRQMYGLRPLSLKQLAVLSPETGRSLARFCSQRRIPIPALGLLPIAEPVILSYGVVPWVTRTVVSQGVLDRLADDEIATLYANEVGQISLGTVPLLSLVAVLMQLPYELYRRAADWGVGKTLPTSRIGAAAMSGLSYGVYALWRWVAVGAGRSRIYVGDRIAAELTGNPNGYTRALLKLAIGMAERLQQQGQTSDVLERFELLMPMGCRSATTLGSLYPRRPLEPLLAWDRLSPYRQSLTLNQAHPPTGDRLHQLDLYARRWQLESELDFGADIAGVNRRRQAGLTGSQWRSLLLQAAPFVGLAMGVAIAWGLSGLGTVAFRLRVPLLEWMMGDRSLGQALPLIGFSLGTFLRINAFFPDIVLPSQSGAAIADVDWTDWLCHPDRLPVANQPLRLTGKLLGRKGIANLLSQDLWLQTRYGLVQLHMLSAWGPLGNLFGQTGRLLELLHQEVVVTGWWRRGATPWIDLETVRSRSGKTYTSQHPIWSTALAALAALLGIYILFQGRGIF